LFANEARSKQGEYMALVVKGQMSHLWHRLRPQPAAPLVVRRKYLIEVPSSLPAAPLVVHHKFSDRCVVLFRGVGARQILLSTAVEAGWRLPLQNG
jgi:hypothetical protein